MNILRLPSKRLFSYKFCIFSIFLFFVNLASCEGVDTCSSCSSGTFFDSLSASCVSCRPGYKCLGGCNDPTPCGIGEYQPAYGSLACKTCLEGYYAAQEGSLLCTMCPPGYSCGNSSASNLIICNPGSFSTGGQAECTNCYEGTFSSNPGSSGCSDCPAGSYCSEGATKPVLCPAGSFAPAKSTECTTCPPGFYCPNEGSFTAYSCSIGTFSIGNQTQCTICPSGYSCPSTTHAIKQRCIQGTYSLSGQGNCTNCPSGKQCSVDGTSVKSCSPGSYSALGDGTCHECLAGFYCPDTSMALQIPCNLGSYSSPGQSECTTCPPGHYCPSVACTGISDCSLPCNDGSYSLGGQTSCTLCSAGYACESTTSGVMTPCVSGEYSLPGQSSCNLCPPGYFCPSRSNEPMQCPAGTHSSYGQTSCTLALPGYFISLPGSVNSVICDAGYFSSGGAVICTPCNPGYLCPPGSTEASPPSSACPIGGYCAVATTFTPCPVGYYGIMEGGVSAEQACSPCDAGYYCNTVGGTVFDRQLCPSGAYCPVQSAVPISCSPGFLSAVTGQTSINTCVACPRGFYCLFPGTTQGTACPVGFYCPEGTSDYSVYPCPAGTFNDNNGLYLASQCSACPGGHYCLSGSSSPKACAPGTYNLYSGASSNSSCLPCEAGYACPAAGMSALTISCAPGYFCPQGTVYPERYPCPAGRYSDSVSLISQSACTLCPAGFTCGLHTTSETMTKCRKGFYCPEGTQYGRDLPCPAGSFSSQSQLSSQQECSACNPGNYCSGGNTTISGSCAAGYFCPTGTPSSTYFPCPAGTFSNSLGLYSVTECQRCSPGYFCPRGSTLMLPCPNGTYSSSDGTSSAQNCSICPAGYQCLTGSAHPKPCGLGRYSDEMASSCDICPLGKYCASNTSTAVQLVSGGGFWENSNDLVGICFNGTYCPLGMKTVPNLLSHPCPAGYICPPGTEYPVPCPAGTYSKVSGRFEISDCLPSPVGHYSINGSHEPTGLCNPGYYCPLGSTSPNQVPCPTRTYLPGYGGESVEQCSLCTAGGYCPNEGNAIPIVCPKGFYCITGLDEPLPCLPGTYGNASGLTSASECNPCDGGMYCDGYALTSPRGYSYEGFYCISGCNTSTPMYDYSNLIGGLCTEGHYCAKGTVLPTPCPPGTFNPVNGSKVLGDCVPCTSGMYCEGYGNAAPTGPCKRGYYCSGGAYTPTQHEVLPGYYSLAGATNMTACSPGFYNNKYLQYNCTKCVEGYFCPNSGMSTYVEYLCIAGHYCPEGTAIPVRCPAGTFSPLTIYGNYDVKNCTACSSGYYCATAGLVEVTGPCDAGYYCTQKASSKTQPSYTDTGGPCTKGHYCLTGSDYPTPCPRGTYMADKQNDGNRTVRGINYHCDLCLSGKSCNSLGLLSYDGGIAEGYWAVEGAPSVIPVCHDLRVCGSMYGICPIGNHCPVNSSIPTPCGDGFYQDEIGQASCKVCPTGFFCTPSAKFNCPPGSYCPQGTHNQFLCPNGTYGASEGLQNITQCTPCTGGFYCATAGLSSPTGLCDKGYFCGGSSTVATPFGEGSIGGYAITYNGETCVHADNYTVNDICPPGHYCPRGSAAPIMCPPGTNATAVGQFSISGCGLCPAGFYCPNSGTVYATLRCPSGHFCQAGTSSLSQSTICPVGTYCPTGSVQYNSCPGGSYQNSAGMGSCIPCPAGYECPVGSTSYQIECPVNRYCPQGTELGIYCKNGTYGNSTRQISQSDCTTCPGGKYCNQGFILGNCSSGYFCKSGQFSPAPYVDVSQYPDSNVLLHYLQSINGGPCYPGYYCPKATKNPRSCLNGTVRISPYGESQEDCGACPLGYLCSIGNPVPEKCQVGHYCPLKSAQFPCPKGTYNPLSSQFSLDNCTSCPAGFYCNSTGLSSYHNFPCPSGHFCVTKATSAFPCAGGTYRDAIGGIGQADCKTCPGGYFCSNGSSYYKVCNSGTYCPTGSASPTICPPGQYCPANAFVPILCPETYYCPLGASRPTPCSLGTYCPAGTVYPIPCPLGYKAVDNTNHTHHVLASLQSACVKCPAGYYGTDPNRLNCSLGTAGYYFIGASTSDKPTNFTAERGSICPKGTYCPAGSVAPTHCPPGSYQPKMGATSALSCILCQANYYQSGNGSESCFKCSSSSFSTAGSIACSCIGLNRVFQPADGFCICKPGFEFVNSNLEVSSTNDGAFDCQPIVYSRCIAPMVRRQDGSCGSNSDCNSVCKSEGGILDSNTGICLCSNITTLNQACDSNCRNSAPNVTCNSYGQLNVYDPATESSTILSPSQLADLGAGSITCSSGASVYSMKSSASGFAGVFGLGTSLSSLTNRRRLLSSSRDNVNISYNAIAKWNNFIPGINSNPFRESNETNILSFGNPLHRYLANDSSSAPELSNPIVVISAQDSIIFDIGGGYYPQYVKDSLLNTNPNFDYSAFRNLDSSSATVSTFSFTFTEPGNYVFQLSKSASSVLIISVLPQYVTRSTSAQFVEMSNGNLVTVGVKTTTSIVLQPDWNLVIGLLLGMLALVLIVIGGLYYFRKKSWSYHTNIESKYRRKNKAMNENVQHKSSANTSKPVVNNNNKVHIGDDSVADPSPAVLDLESAAFPNDGNELLEFDDEMLLPDLAKHMQTHHDEIDRQLVTQNDLLASLKDVLKKEVEELKSLLASTASNMNIVANGNGDRSQSLESILQQLKSDVLTRALFDDDMTLTEKRMITFLDRTLRELRPEVDKIASTIVHEMAEQAIDLSDRDEAIVAVRSPSLREIIDDMTELKAFVDSSLLDGIVTERKRKQAAEDAFDSAIRMSPQLIFPLSVSEKLKPSKDAEIDLDIIHDDIISSIKIFSEKVPQFCTTMEEVESSLSMGLARTVNTGNVSVIEREQVIASQALCTYFGELLNAVNILIASIGEQQSKLVSVTEQCRDVRIELVAAIDAILNPAKVAMVGESHAAMDRTDSNTQQILDSILAALKEQRYVDKGESPQKRGKRGKRSSTEPNIVDDENSLDGSDREDAASETSDGLQAGELSDEDNDETDEMSRSKSGDLTFSASSKSMVDNIGESVPQNNRKSEDPKKQHTSKKSDPSKSVADKDESNEDFETFGATSTDNDAQETDERTAGENSAQNLMLLRPKVEPIAVNAAGELLITRSVTQNKGKVMESSKTDSSNEKEKSVTERQQDSSDPSLSANAAAALAAAQNALKEIKDQAKEELQDIRDQFSSDSKKLKEEFELEAKKEKSILEKRLKSRHQKRLNELTEQDSKSSEEAAALLKREDERLRKELDDKLQQQLEQVLAKKAAEAEEIEKQIMEHERIESAKANAVKEAALRRMAQVKKDHLDEIHHLEESLLQKHTEHELKLKKTLMEKKLHSLNEHEKQRLEMEAKFAEEELQNSTMVETPLKSSLKRQGTAEGSKRISFPDDGLDSRLSTPRLFAGDVPDSNNFDQKVIENVLNNETLTNLQKEDLLDAAQADMKMMDSILDLERKRQELIMKQAFETNPTESSALEEQSTVNTNAAEEEQQRKKFEEEKQQLQKSLEEERNKKLDELMQNADPEETELDADGAGNEDNTTASIADSLGLSTKVPASAFTAEEEASKPTNEKKLKALSESRIAALYRYWAFSAKISYKELVLRFNVNRTKVQISKYDTGGSVKADSAGNINSLHVQDCEDQLNGLDIEQEMELISLQSSLQSSLEETLKAENERRDTWLAQKDSGNIDLPTETAAFIKEYKKKFMSLSGKMKKLSDLMKETNKLNRELKLAMFKSRSFTLDTKDFKSILDVSKSELEESNLLVEKMQEEDLRVLFAEEALLLQMLEHPTKRLEKSDEITAQSHLHLRVLGVMNAHSTILPRLSMLENELLYETKAIRLSNSMLRQKASKEKIEEALAALFEEKKNGSVEILTKLQESFMNTKTVEKKRQEGLKKASFELERARAIEEHARRDAQTALDMSKSQRKIQVALLFALEEKKTILVENARNAAVSSDEIRQLALQQVDAELIRDELEMKVAFDSFEVGFTLVERYSSEVLLGVQPSTAYIKQLVKVSHSSELHFTQQAIKLDECRKRFKKLLAAALYTDFERKRLQSLERISGEQHSEDLDKILLEIKQQTAEEIHLIDVATSAELWRVDNMFAQQLDQNVKIHDDFAVEIEDLARSHEKEKEVLLASFERHKEYTIGTTSGQQASEERDRALDELEQRFVNDIARVDVKFEDSLYSSFKKVMSRILSQVQVEMELANLRNRIRQESEAVESVVAAGKQTELQTLIVKQAERRAELKQSQIDLKKQLEEEAKMAEEKYKQEKREIEATKQEREISLAEELKSSGVEDSEALVKAAAEVSKLDKEKILAAKQNLKQIVSEKVALLSRAEGELKQKLSEIELREDDESKELRSEQRNNDRELSSGSDGVSEIVKAASTASKEVQDKTREELADIKEKLARDSDKLKEEFAIKAEKERSVLENRLKGRHQKRISELMDQHHKSAPEAEAILNRENEKYRKELNDQLQLQLDQVLSKKAREAADIERQVLESEHKAATSEAARANSDREAALRRMAQVKKDHMDDMRHLEEDLIAKRKEHEDHLKKLLKERKARALKELTDEKQRLEMEAQLAHEELESLNKLQLERSAEEAALKEKQRVEMEKKAAAAIEELQKAELAAAKAAAKESTIRGLKDTQKQSEEELNMKEVQRLRNVHKMEEDKETEASQLRHNMQSNKLHDKLQRKRQRKEQELRTQEQREIQELVEKQQREKEEKEALRAAKLSWNEKIQEVLKVAEEMGLSQIEKEDYCFRETLGKNLVPATQLNEAVQMVQRKRHDQEMAKLLKKNFEERVAKLTAAVEEVIENKSKSRISLIEGLMKAGTYDQLIESETAKLDAEYHKKQIAAEHNVTAALEDQHLKSQMELRQQQLVEIAHIVALYTDKDTLEKLNISSGKTQEEELLEYKNRIEAEKKQREEALAKEREDMETKLREKMQDEVNKMQVQLQEEQSKAEAEFNRKRNMVLKQREEFEKKKAEEMEQLDNLEKARILSNFEKEHAAAQDVLDQDRKNKKAKLADRLQKRKSTIHQSLPTEDSKHLATIAERVPTGSEPTSVKVSKDKDAHASHSHSHRKSSKDGVDEIPVTSAVAQATAAAAQVAATQASSAAAAATVLQSSIKQIEGKLEKIEKVMLALEKNASPPTSTQLPVAVPPGETASTTAPAPPAPVYQDRDEPVPGDALELIADSDVTIQDRARIEFGKKLAMMIGVKNLTIKSAASLPPSPFTDNAFANSYRYTARDNTLVVHTNRLQSVGDFALILIHALSHIKVNPEDLSNDLDTKFMTEFYRNMKILSLDLYKKTAALSSQGNQQTAAGPGNFASFSLSSSKSKSNLLGSSLRGKKTPSQITTDLPPISDNSGKIDLSALALESPSGANASKSESMTTLTHPQEYFSSESLMERMKMYTQHGNIPADYLEKYAAVYQPQASTALGAAKSTHSDT